MSAMNCCVWTG